MGTNKFASQQGMTAYGTRRHLYDPKLGTDQPLDQATISLQMGTNKGASQVRETQAKEQAWERGRGVRSVGLPHEPSLLPFPVGGN